MLQGRESSPKSYQQIVSSGQHDKLAIGAALREEEVHWILNWGEVKNMTLIRRVMTKSDIPFLEARNSVDSMIKLEKEKQQQVSVLLL